MKSCPYCNTGYTPSEVKCPSCQATDYKTKCDNCGNIHKSAFCPNCGMGANETLFECPECSTKTKDLLCPKCGHGFLSNSSVKAALGGLVTKASCVFGHDWFGCKCKRCGKIRDEEHNFQSVEGKCERRCSVCRKTEANPKQHQWRGDLWKGRECIKCGFVQPPAYKRGGFWIIVCALFLIIVVSIGTASEKADEPFDGKILPVTPLEIEQGIDYQDVLTQLQVAGFTNFETKALGDLITGWLTKEGSVERITVNGKNLSANTKYAIDDKIVISYHSFPENEDDVLKYDDPAYEIVKTVGNHYWVLIDDIDYSTDEYKKQVKNIIKEVTRKANTIELVVDVIIDRNIAELEQNEALPEELEGWVARYTGNSGYVVHGSMIEIDPAHEGFDYNGSVRRGRVFQIEWKKNSAYSPSIENWQPY